MVGPVLVGVGLIMSFEVEYCLAANSVRCRIYECFVEFCFVYWTGFAFYTNTNTNTNKFIIRNKAHTCMRAGTNVKQVINMNVHYKTK